MLQGTSAGGSDLPEARRRRQDGRGIGTGAEPHDSHSGRQNTYEKKAEHAEGGKTRGLTGRDRRVERASQSPGPLPDPSLAPYNVPGTMDSCLLFPTN